MSKWPYKYEEAEYFNTPFRHTIERHILNSTGYSQQVHIHAPQWVILGAVYQTSRRETYDMHPIFLTPVIDFQPIKYVYKYSTPL